MPHHVEHGLSSFTSLVARATPDGQARERFEQLADEQAALRRIATLVAQGAPPTEASEAVAREVAGVMHVPVVAVGRYDDDGALLTIIGAWSEHPQPFEKGTRWPLYPESSARRVLETGRPARAAPPRSVPQVVTPSHAAAPIVVDGRVWGVIAMFSASGPLADDLEHRLADFTELVATALSTSQAREDLRRLADEQTALRNVATLVARESPAAGVFAAVAEEAGRLLAIDESRLVRYEDDGTITSLACWGELAEALPVGTNTTLDGETVVTLVRRTQRPARVEDYGEAPGVWAAYLRKLGLRSGAGAPVLVQGRVWGALLVASRQEEPLPAGIESRLEDFADLVAAAIANTEAREDLAASRARIVEAADAERRRLARDLHDGAQARLLHAVIAFERAKRAGHLPPRVDALVDEGLAHARSAVDDLRELARGIHPAILTNRGLAAAAEELAERCPLPVDVDVPSERQPAAVESTAYFVIAEALTNVEKHARASRARVAVTRTRGALRVVVEDDGMGGAGRTPGGGIAGLIDRVAAVDGVLAIESPPAGGTRIRADLPLSPKS